MISDKQSVQDLVHLLAAHGVKHVVLSPGSRNAPLTLSFEHDARFTCHLVVDERSAGFVALGMAQQLRQPVAVCSTSGSAAFNYAPAVAEAFFQRIPLVVLTADRPVEWIDQGDGQTIRQNDIFGRHVLQSVQLHQDPCSENLRWHNSRMINGVLNQCKSDVKGPVHINIPLSENLYGHTLQTGTLPVVIENSVGCKSFADDQYETWAADIQKRNQVLILTGMLNPSEKLNQALAQLGRHSNINVMTETISNLHDPHFIDATDRLIMTFSPEEEKAFRPDLLITVGTNIISKKIKALLRKEKPEAHWHVDESEFHMDTFQSLTQNIVCRPEDFFSKIGRLFPQNGSNKNGIRQQFSGVKEAHKKFLQDVPWSDLRAFDTLLPMIPAGSNFQMGNSSVVRYVQLFGSNRNLTYNANRGTSGIDGCTSTAVGAALVNKKPTTLITGDLSFFYDSNGLWQSQLSDLLKIVIINNGGGGIFRIIEGPKESGLLDPYFETPHNLDARNLCEMHKIKYFSVHEKENLMEEIIEFYAFDECAILEIFTPKMENDKVLKSYFQFLKNNKDN